MSINNESTDSLECEMISMSKQSFETELNFVFEFELSKKGIIEQIKKSLTLFVFA